MATLILIVAMFALLWLLLIRPQRQKQANQERLIESVEPGDEILTVGGLYGIVEELDEEGDLVVEVAEGIQVRIARRAVATVVKPEDEEEAEEGEIAGELEPVDDEDGEPGVNDREQAVSEPETEGSTAAPRS